MRREKVFALLKYGKTKYSKFCWFLIDTLTIAKVILILRIFYTMINYDCFSSGEKSSNECGINVNMVLFELLTFFTLIFIAYEFDKDK